MLPQGVAFATIAGLPPEYGLYAAMVPAVVAATLTLDGESANVQADPPELRKLATVAAFWLCTRALSEVAVVPIGSAAVMLALVTTGFVWILVLLD